MDQYELIRTAHRVYGHSISQISRDTGHSRNTIRKALRQEAWGYTPRSKQPLPVLEPFTAIIDDWLRQDRDQPPKQRHTARRIYHRLVAEHNFSGSESNVRKYVREARLRLGLGKNQAFIPLLPELGKEAEIDWGTATVELAGKTVKYKLFCMRSKGSGKVFARLYPCERQQAFFDGMIRGFSFFGGIFPILIFDNLTTAVKKVLQGKKRLEQTSFTKFRAYYNFTVRFCNLASGHEKGGVEGIVGFVRRNFLVPIPKAETLEEINERLLRDCVAYGSHRITGRQETVSELFAREKESLIKLPQKPFSNIHLYHQKADKYSTVIIDKNRYSVPYRYSGCQLTIAAAYDHIVIFSHNKEIARHRRLYNNNRWQLNPDHYLELIQQRPLAFDSARPIRSWRETWPEEMETLLARFIEAQGKSRGTKDFIQVLMLFRSFNSTEVIEAVRQAVKSSVSNSAGVNHFLRYNRESPTEFQPVSGWKSQPPADISLYSELGGLQ